MEKEINQTMKKRPRFFVLGLPMALNNFAIALTGVVLTDLIVYRTCLIPLSMSETECSIIRCNASSLEALRAETEVEPYATKIVMSKMLMESVIPALISIFLGSWSDRGGRKPLLLAGFGGSMAMYITLTLMSGWNISPWYLLIASIPACLMGGQCSVILGSICHISDTTTEKDRMTQLARLEAAGFIGDVLGGLTGPFIYKRFGYSNVFGTAAICSTLAVVYTYFLIPETVVNPSQKSIRGLFNVSVVKNLFTGSSAKREGFSRFIVWLAILTITLNAMIDKGHAAIEFLFTRVRLSWNVQYYFYFNTTGVVLRIIGLSAVLLRGHISDTILVGIGFMSALGSAITKSLAWKDWHMYLAAFIGTFSGIMPSVMRSVITTFAPAEEIGKVFSLATLLEILSPLGGSPLYTLVYSHYLPPIYPSPVFIVSTTFFVFLVLCVLCIDAMIRKSRNPPPYIVPAKDGL